MKRVFSLLLVLLLMVGLVPVQALADGSGPEVEIKIVAGAGHGSVSISPAAPAPGDTVQVTATADAGYELKELHLTGSGVDSYVDMHERSFLMPEVSVTLEVSFGPAGDSETFGATVAYVYYDINNPNQGYIDYFVDENVTPGRYEFVPLTGYTIHHIESDDAIVYDNRYVDVPEFGYISATVWLQTGSGSTPQPPAAQPHSITVTPNGNGTASTTVNGSPANTATKGEIVTVTGTPAENHYVLSAVARTAADNPVTDFAKKDEGIFTFTMPDEDVEITVYFQEMTSYQVKVNQPVDGHGTVAATPAEQLMGRPVTVTVTPEDGYRLAGITVTNDTTTQKVSLQADGKTFYMPDSDVTVTASFEAIPSHKVTVTKPDCVTLDISNGEEIREGAPVTIIPRIDGDFMPETLTITGPNGEKIELNDNHQFIMPSGPVTIEITVVPSVTITFAPNGGTVDPAAVTIQEGTTLGTLPQPVRQDYLFTGWYPAAGDKITTSTVFDTNTTVTARWVKAEHTTNLRGNDFGADIAMENIDVLDLLLDEDDLSQGKDIIVYMEVDKLGELAVPKEDKSAIDAKAGSDKLAAYLDITLWKKIGDDPETRITNTNGDVPITMTLDEGIVPADAGSVYIIYYHEGKVATITNGVSYNASSRVLRFPANEFSTYALAYKVQAPAATTSAGVLDNVPKTGDETGLVGWTMLVLCSAAMLAAVAVFDKKRAR